MSADAVGGQSASVSSLIPPNAGVCEHALAARSLELPHRAG